MIELEKLIASADEIDSRLGPIPGRSSDRIAKELRLAAQVIERLRKALQDVVRDINDYEKVNNLAPNPGRTECWDSVGRAKEALALSSQEGKTP